MGGAPARRRFDGGRILYALAAVIGTAYGAYFAWWKTEAIFIARELPLPFERFGAVTATAAVFFLIGFFITVYQLIFESTKQRTST